MKTIKTTVYLNASDYRRLKSLAADEGRSAAELVREAVAQYAARATEREWPRSIGIADSGDPHFAENYEDYLDGFGEEGLEDYFASLESDSAREDSVRRPHGLSE
ncbi:MAG: CopG family transcriptional regulator [Gemmatimonadetes bacterium]|nr:CopG family transcriptional regulator [Gemmatimonadota bacterium]MXX72126.1 CopG family transcriptional regulator [Gemmatimonadota bacterium]MYC90741.1 CopG family transcriptional regulator [Gemmatimonadota bacterium]MYG34778.1 CopG family transcriptional regulator [Gemmatimonadota bacterium]MYJ18847.1 CopG family transcriptional regulator [Gemmatimonadota bacterium]